MKTPLGTEVDLGLCHIVLDEVPAPAKRAQQPPLFGPCLLWRRSPISSTAELLFAFRVSRRRREMYCGHARLRVCLSVRGRMRTLLHGPGCNLGDW